MEILQDSVFPILRSCTLHPPGILRSQLGGKPRWEFVLLLNVPVHDIGDNFDAVACKKNAILEMKYRKNDPFRQVDVSQEHRA